MGGEREATSATEDALSALEYAQRVRLPALMDSAVDWVMLRRPDDPVEAVLEWAVMRLKESGREEWLRERVIELAPPPEPPKSPEPETEIVWADPPRPWDYVHTMHDALLLVLNGAAQKVRSHDDDDKAIACAALKDGLRLHAFLCHCEAEIFSPCDEWSLHQLHEASEAARDWADRLLPVITSGAAGATVTGRTAEEFRRFADSEGRRLRRQDAVLRSIVDDDRPSGPPTQLSGPPKLPFVQRLVGCDRCELECHAVPLVVRTLCSHRPYDATRRLANAMQAAVTTGSYKPIGEAIRIAALRSSPSYARLLQGEGLLDISIDDDLTL